MLRTLEKKPFALGPHRMDVSDDWVRLVVTDSYLFRVFDLRTCEEVSRWNKNISAGKANRIDRITCHRKKVIAHYDLMYNPCIAIWDALTGRSAKFIYYSGQIMSMHVFHTFIVIAHRDTINVFHVENGRYLYSIPVKGSFSGKIFHQGHFLVVCSVQGMFLWDMRTRQVYREYDIYNTTTHLMSITDKYIAARIGINAISVWDVDTTEYLYSVEHTNLDSVICTSKYIIVGSGRHILIYDIRDGKCLTKFKSGRVKHFADNDSVITTVGYVTKVYTLWDGRVSLFACMLASKMWRIDGDEMVTRRILSQLES